MTTKRYAQGQGRPRTEEHASTDGAGLENTRAPRQPHRPRQQAPPPQQPRQETPAFSTLHRTRTSTTTDTLPTRAACALNL